MATTKARYTSQMIVLTKPDVAGEINAYAIKSNIPKSELLREALLGGGWPRVRANLKLEYGALTRLELQYGILAALPKEEREAYAAKHGLDWNDPRCQVSRDGRGAAMHRSGTAE